MGATAIDLLLLKRGITKSRINSSKTVADLENLHKVKTSTPLGGRVIGEFSRRSYDSEKIGIPIRNLSTENIKITHRGIDFVEKHLSRFQADKANQVMVKRLRNIADGKIKATQQDLNFYSHELRESIRYKNLGYPKGTPNNIDEAHKLWENTHTPTLEEYRIKENPRSLTENPLYHPDATKFFFEDFD